MKPKKSSFLLGEHTAFWKYTAKTVPALSAKALKAGTVLAVYSEKLV